MEALEPHIKDGGVFVKFKYTASEADGALERILHDLRQSVHSQGGVPSWCGLSSGEVWLVKGAPWREVCSSITMYATVCTHPFQDMHRYVSAILKVSFDGPDVSDESLYRLLRVRPSISDCNSLIDKLCLAVREDQ